MLCVLSVVFQEMGTIILGKLESGTIRKGQSLTLMPNKVRRKIAQNRFLDIDETKTKSHLAH